MIRFAIDPTLVADAIAQGRQLIVEVRAPKIYRVTLGDPSPHRPRLAIGKAG